MTKIYAFLITLCFAGICLGGADKPLPNIIILADDLGYGDVGCFGSKLVETPNIDAQKHAWYSTLGGHAVSPNGIDSWKILPPAVDERTKPTGEFREYQHPNWSKEDPKNYPTGKARYEVHESEQNANGDWSAISIGEQNNLFAKHPEIVAKLKKQLEDFHQEFHRNTRPAGVANQP